MEVFSSLVNSVNNILWSRVLIVALVGCGIWFTLSTRFVQLRMLPEMLRVLTDGVGAKNAGKEAINSFQAFCISAAARVGVGNIAGVAIAIVTGGPGALFWMWAIAFFGCATGFVESTLAQIYKLPRGDGKFHGGPAYYIQNALHQPGLAKLFAVLISVTYGLICVSVQANTIALSVQSAFAIPPTATGVFLCVGTALVIFGGMKRIARFTEVLVPVMAVLYLIVALIVMAMYIDQMPAMFALILHDAFHPQAAVGGGIGIAILTGCQRGLFSSEAGVGSVPNAAATADVSHPVKQGLVQSFGVYVDTWIVCSATAFIVLLTGQYEVGGELTGIALAQASLVSLFGPFASAAIALTILLFAFSSIVGNYYYGEVNIAFFEHAPAMNRKVLNLFRAGVVLMVFFGCLAELKLVWNLADLFLGSLCLMNLYAVVRLAKHARVALDDYVAMRQAGLEPKFDPNILSCTDGVQAWGEILPKEESYEVNGNECIPQ